MNLLTDNIKKLYLKFLLPSLGSAMAMSVYTLTDAIVIGKGVGPDALAALSFTTPLLCILMSTGILFGAVIPAVEIIVLIISFIISSEGGRDACQR